MSLQVVIPVEALWAGVALERSVVLAAGSVMGRWVTVGTVSINLGRERAVARRTTVIASQHAPADNGQRRPGTVQIREHGAVR